MLIKNNPKEVEEYISDNIKYDKKEYILYKKLKEISFFKKLLEEGHKRQVIDFIKKLEIKEYNKNELLFKQFSVSDRFYTILSGEVNIFHKRKNGDKKIENEFYSQEFYEKFKKDPFFYHKSRGHFLHQLVATIREGESFGELGLLYNQTRSRTLVTTSKTVLAELNSENFQNIIKKQIFNKINKKNKYFKSILKEFCNDKEIFQISVYFNKFKKNKGSYLFRENEKFDKIFLIVKGNILLEKKIIKNNLNKKNNENLFNDKSEKLNKISKEVF